MKKLSLFLMSSFVATASMAMQDSALEGDSVQQQTLSPTYERVISGQEDFTFKLNTHYVNSLPIKVSFTGVLSAGDRKETFDINFNHNVSLAKDTPLTLTGAQIISSADLRSGDFMSDWAIKPTILAEALAKQITPKLELHSINIRVNVYNGYNTFTSAFSENFYQNSYSFDINGKLEGSSMEEKKVRYS